MNLRKFGTMRDGREVFAYTLTSDEASVTILNYGAIIQSYNVFGVDIVGGFDKLDSYLDDASHQGGIVGRVGNRVANAELNLGGKVYHLTKNNGNNSLHGGHGFDRRLWEVTSYSDTEITLRYVSEDGEEGYPSSVDTMITYTLLGASLMLSYTAIPDGETPISLTNHSYFNLDGLGGDVLEHRAQFFADRYTEVNDELIPTGNRPSVVGTPFDFNEPKKIGHDIGTEFDGYDHNIFLAPTKSEIFLEKELSLVAIIDNERLKMSVYTDQPCIQFYIACSLEGADDFKGGIKAIKFGGMCLETQIEPNSVNHGVGIYKKGDIYTHNTVYKIERIG